MLNEIRSQYIVSLSFDFVSLDNIFSLGSYKTYYIQSFKLKVVTKDSHSLTGYGMTHGCEYAILLSSLYSHIFL